MPKNPEIPLYLYQVLEDEYESLHGPIPREVTAHLPNHEDEGKPLEVVSKRDWDFHEGHIKFPKLFASLLLSDAAPQWRMSATRAARHAGPTDSKMVELKKHLRKKINDDELLKRIDGFKLTNDGSTEEKNELDRLAGLLADRLNAALADPELYAEQSGQSKKSYASGKEAASYWEFEWGKEYFAYIWLNDEARGLLSLRRSRVPFGEEDVKHLNRLLLEDAFTDIFQKAYDVRLAAVYKLFHAAKQSAISLSGGGIRSGTFALGLLQGLARHGLLEKFDYLSTVSGGGYIGGWLSGWIHRHPEGLAGVSRDLAYGATEKVDPDPAPLRYLRRYSNFITPKVGLLTADTWTFAGIYIRNTFLNWLVFVPLILSALLIPRLLLALTLMQEEANDLKPIISWGKAGVGQTLEPGFYSRHIFLTLGILFGCWALAYVIFNRPGLRATLEERRPWFRGKTGQGGFLKLCLIPLLVSAFFLTTYFAWSREVNEVEETALWKFLLFGVVFVFLGWLIASFVLKRLSRARLRETKLFELLGLILAGTAGGALFYVFAQLPLFDSPVLGYNQDPKFWTTTTDWLVWNTELYVCLAVPIFLLIFLLAVILFIGFTSANWKWANFIEDEDREWWARFGAWLLISIIVWVAVTVVVIFGPIALLWIPAVLGTLGGISGLVTLLAGRSSQTPASEGAQAQPSKLAGLMGSLLPLLALVFVIFLAAAFSLATSGLFEALAFVAQWLHNKPYFAWLNPSWVTNVPDAAGGYRSHMQFIYNGIHTKTWEEGSQLVHMNVLHHTWFWLVLALGLVLYIFGGKILARVINLNIFSLHGGYRNRLIRGFLGASRPDHERRPNPFTGFDPSDNLHMHELRHALLAENDFDEGRLRVIVEKLLAAAEEAGKTAAVAKGIEEGVVKGAASAGAQPLAEIALTRDENVSLLSRQLVGHEMFESVRDKLKAYDPDAPAPPQLMTDLRTFFNAVIEGEPLYEKGFGSALLQEGHAPYIQERIKSETLRRVADAEKRDAGPGWQSLRTDYQLLLNRLVLEQAYDGAIKPCVAPPYKMMHVVNTTLNLVGGSNLAWQQRKAEPFSISPLHSGCFRVGYRNSRDYGGRDTNGISLGTAATASGAAASSNMGYYTTSPVISLLLTLFNVRLGLWLGNPGPHGQETYHLNAPTLSFKPVLSEAFGLTDDKNEYVYLTDGGHFENLAIYEMVLRRCHFIVVSDAAQDEKFSFGDLGNAVRKIRIDLGVPIDFWDVPIYPQAPSAEEGRGVYWALARIRYTEIDKGPGTSDGVLLYIKPTVYGDEPRDVIEYKKSFPAFPHQSTGDQFFDEPQFESYRMLGLHIMSQICGDKRDPLEPKLLISRALEGLKKARPDGSDFSLNAEFLEWINKWRSEAGVI